MVGLLFVAVLVNYIDRNNISVAAVPVMAEFGFSPSAAGALMSAFFWSYTLLQIPSGWAVDRFGPRWTYGVAFLLWSLSSAAIGLARSFGQIFGLRLVLGASQAAVQPVSLSYIRRHFTESEQGLPTGIYISGMMIGPAVGGFLGGVLLERLGWREMFVLTGLVPCLWLLPWFWLAPKGRGAAQSAAVSSSHKLPLRKLFSNPVRLGNYHYGFLLFLLLVFLHELAAVFSCDGTRPFLSPKWESIRLSRLSGCPLSRRRPGVGPTTGFGARDGLFLSAKCL